jgi:hypothetical protein
MRHASIRLIASIALLSGAPTGAALLEAQDLAARVNAVREGDVRVTFALRPDVCGHGRNVWYSGRSSVSTDARTTRDVEYDVDCDSGPGRLVIVRRDGETAGLRFYVGGKWRASSTATDLGQVASRSAADYLMALAETHDGKAGRDAIFPATLADSVTIWPRLMQIARNERRPRSTREGATFWLGQLAGEPATRGLAELVADDTLDRKVRESAIFALSNRRNQEGVPALINVVRTSKDPQLRRSALFWLANTKDPRALDLIEELLTKK